MENMTDFQGLPKAIQKHIMNLAGELGRSEDTEYISSLVQVWKQKEELFRQQSRSVRLELAGSVAKQDGRGMMILTYSGSILCIGPVFSTATNINFSRWIEYSSIKLRTEVPDIIVEKNAVLAENIAQAEPVRLDNSRIESTSPAYLIAVCPENLAEEEQDKRIRESAVFITAGFMKFNQSIQIDSKNMPDQFTMKSMVRFIAKKHGLTAQEAKLIIDDFCTLIETGMLMGESVPFGKLGRFSIKTREAQRARVIKHPATGEEVTVSAKPAKGIPRISFSTYFKERAENVVDEAENE